MKIGVYLSFNCTLSYIDVTPAETIQNIKKRFVFCTNKYHFIYLGCIYSDNRTISDIKRLHKIYNIYILHV